MDEKKFALLIDSDNVSSKYIKIILAELAKYGNVTYKRLYGDLTKPTNKSWKDALLSHSIIPIQQYNYTTGKNSTDSAMIIDAMDILYSGHVDGFCLATSDSDFTRLAMRLRESGMTVIGMGEQKTPEAFRESCERFFYLDLLADASSEEHSEEKIQIEEEPITPLPAIEAIIRKIIIENGTDGTSMDLGELGSRITKTYSSFDIRNYGYNKFSKFLEQFHSLRLESTSAGVTAHLQEVEIPLELIEHEIINILKEEPKNTINLGKLNQMLTKTYPDFNIHNYGYSRFSKLLSEFKAVKVGALARSVTLDLKALPPEPVKPVKAPRATRTRRNSSGKRPQKKKTNE
ncbi:MAG: NYN domain-containing protein [Lachnospiraceae bacterium]|nr:NYN domain-containing protein [Lachnospiraceae bacterium]